MKLKKPARAHAQGPEEVHDDDYDAGSGDRHWTGASGSCTLVLNGTLGPQQQPASRTLLHSSDRRCGQVIGDRMLDRSAAVSAQAVSKRVICATLCPTLT